MGCFGSKDDDDGGGGGGGVSEEREMGGGDTRGIAKPTASTAKDDDISAILNMNKQDTSEIPSGYVAAPTKPEWKGEGTEEEYKAYMRNKYKYEQWENGLILYKMRMKDGASGEQLQQIVDRILNELNS